VSSGAACFVFVECHLSRTRISGVRFVPQSNEGSVSERAGSSRHENHGIISAAAASCRFGSTSPRVVVGDLRARYQTCSRLPFPFYLSTKTCSFVLRLQHDTTDSARLPFSLSHFCERFEDCADTTYRDNVEETFLVAKAKSYACFTPDSDLEPAC